MIVHFKPTEGGSYTDYRPPSRPNASRLDIFPYNLGHRRNDLNFRTDSINFHNLLIRNVRKLFSFYFFVPLQFDDFMCHVIVDSMTNYYWGRYCFSILYNVSTLNFPIKNHNDTMDFIRSCPLCLYTPVVAI